MNTNDYSFPVYFLASEPTEPFEHSSIPTTFIISREGSIKLKKKGAAKWNGRKIIKLLDELIRE